MFLQHIELAGLNSVAIYLQMIKQKLDQSSCNFPASMSTKNNSYNNLIQLADVLNMNKQFFVLTLQEENISLDLIPSHHRSEKQIHTRVCDRVSK